MEFFASIFLFLIAPEVVYSLYTDEILDPLQATYMFRLYCAFLEKRQYNSSSCQMVNFFIRPITGEVRLDADDYEPIKPVQKNSNHS